MGLENSDKQSNRFRSKYRSLSVKEQQAIDDIKGHATKLDSLLENLLYDANKEEPYIGADPRALALARTKLEESIMWAVKAVSA